MIKHSIIQFSSSLQDSRFLELHRGRVQRQLSSSDISRQQGVALFITIIFLVLVTSLAAVMITDSRMGSNAIGLTRERFENEQELLGGYDEIISDVSLIDTIMTLSDSAAIASKKFENVSVEMTLRNDSYCKRSAQASSVNLINCKYVKMSFSQEKSSSGRIKGGTLASGIAQPFLAEQNK